MRLLPWKSNTGINVSWPLIKSCPNDQIKDHNTNLRRLNYSKNIYSIFFKKWAVRNYKANWTICWGDHIFLGCWDWNLQTTELYNKLYHPKPEKKKSDSFWASKQIAFVHNPTSINKDGKWNKNHTSRLLTRRSKSIKSISFPSSTPVR